MRLCLLAGLIFVVPTPGQAASLSGRYELQSLGGDRDFTLEQKGNKLVAHRVMWPEWEGERYKLEHLYRGKVSGKSINGKLLVREEGVPEYEVLRSFKGSIESGGKVIIDGLPLKRTGKGAAVGNGGTGDRGSQAPKLSQNTTAPPAVAAAPKPAPPAEVSAAPTEPVDPEMNLFDSIMGTPGMANDLFKISNAVTLPDGFADLTGEGDALFAKRKYRAAIKKYAAAGKEGTGNTVGLLHRLGRCHLKLKECAKAKQLLARALRLDPNNPELRDDYGAAKAC